MAACVVLNLKPYSSEADPEAAAALGCSSLRSTTNRLRINILPNNGKHCALPARLMMSLALHISNACSQGALDKNSLSGCPTGRPVFLFMTHKHGERTTTATAMAPEDLLHPPPHTHTYNRNRMSLERNSKQRRCLEPTTLPLVTLVFRDFPPKSLSLLMASVILLWAFGSSAHSGRYQRRKERS